jgi:hypothetical protein
MDHFQAANLQPGPQLAGPLPTAQPTPCLGCGAPMDVAENVGLHVNPKLRCGYCRREEDLPADAAERHRHLRLRLLQVQRARETLEAPLKTYQAVKSSFVMASGFAAVFGAWQLSNLFTNMEAAERLRQAGFEGTYIQSIILAALGPAFAVGMIAGYLGMSRVFKRAVRPMLLARAPRAVGLAARCRSCGGELPQVRAPQVTCRYCSAMNLLGDTLTQDTSQLLQKEAEHYHALARGVNPDPKAYLAPSRAFYLWGGLGTVLTLVLLAGALLALG